jgi:hypothetical protein
MPAFRILFILEKHIEWNIIIWKCLAKYGYYVPGSSHTRLYHILQIYGKLLIMRIQLAENPWVIKVSK